MNSERPGRAEVVIGPAGQALSVDNLPSPETKRWVMSRKADLPAQGGSRVDIKFDDGGIEHGIRVHEIEHG